MSMKSNWKKRVSLFVVFALLIGSVTGIKTQWMEAAAKKKIRSVKITQAGKNVTKKTLKMKVGTSKKLSVKTKPATAKKKIKFKSSNKKVVTVSKNGRLKAKKSGSAKIRVTVSKKGYKTKKTWVKISVGKSSDKNQKKDSQKDENKIPDKTPDRTPDKTPDKTPDVTTAPTGAPTPSESPKPGDGKILVAYFSWSGTSERIAQNIIAQTGAETNARPPLKNPIASVEQYEKIVLCYPIWWHTAPMTVGTFLERYDFTGKTIYPVSQSASMSTSQYDQSVAFVKECAKGATVDDGLFTKDNDLIRKYVENTVLKAE